jgi:hypothetical protein
VRPLASLEPVNRPAMFPTISAMIKYKQTTFDSLCDRGEALKIESMRFEECIFSSCFLSLTTDLRRRSRAKNIEIFNCSANGCDVGPAILEDVTVDGLATNDLLIIWGALFNRVRLSEAIGKVKINHYIDAVDRRASTQGPFDKYRHQFYSSIDWALDISKARFKEFDVRGIPARLIRRDAETQVVITRERALKPGWREGMSSSNTLWPFMIRLFLSDGDPDMVLVAPLGAAKKKRDELIRGLHELRELGVAEPN